MEQIVSPMRRDINFVKSILPSTYLVVEHRQNAIRCSSPTGIVKAATIDAEDEEHWYYILESIKKHFGERFSEVFHYTCFCHTDFIIYLKP